ncbi:MAG: ATP-binding protein [Candidatus Taylorbacteria bacterium]|nr:ATP-binding protein [Candidatus Taylorbacteria bacterium]
MEITVYAVLIWITAVLIGSLGVVVFLGSKNLSSRVFAHSVLWITIWIIGVGLFIANRDENMVLFSRLTYFLGTTIATSFLYFFITYPEDKKPSSLLGWVLIISQYLLAYIFIFTDKIIYNTFPIKNVYHIWGWSFGQWSYLFEILFFSFFVYGITILYKKYLLSSDRITRKNLKLMLWAITVGTIPPSICCIILPRFGYYNLNWLGPVTEIIWVPIIAYSIIKYRQMNVRAVVTEVLAIAMSAIFFINIFIQTPFGLWGRIGSFMAFLILAYYLIRATLREAKHRSQLHDLNTNLEAKVAVQTVEIRKAYEAEKHARIELEKLNDAKDQFIMITQHHLRTPVMSMLWALESSLKGAYGKLNAGLETVLRDTEASGKRLMRIVDDFLNITTVKVGTNILNISETSLKPAIVDILAELRSNIAAMHITVKYPQNDEDWPAIPVDASKMRESLFIIMENAVRYNRDGGSITITTATHDHDNSAPPGSNASHGGNFEITIENTGLGISPEESQKIGSALFYRGEFARKAYPIGMGVGLSVVKAIIRAHHGTFTIESRGKNEGARVRVKLPI